MTSLPSNRSNRTPLLVAIGVSFVLILLSYWGGFPHNVPVTTLALGIGILLAALLAFGFLVYWFYVAPVPDKELKGVTVAARSPLIRQIIGTAVLVMSFLIVIGFFWDELWHRLYGVGEVVNDFWWRPHVLIYTSMGINALFALGGMALIMMRGRGTMRQRFRAEPLLGLLSLAAGFQIVTAPLDPMWHQVYGLDITAWSLPHLTLLIGILSVMLVGSSIQLSLASRRPWRALGGLGLPDLIVIAIFAMAVIIFLQFGTVEWESISAGDVNRGGYGAFFARPEWLYPVVLVGIATLVAMTITHLTRRVGVATLVFALNLAVRVLLITIFNAAAPPADMTFKTNLLIVFPGIALDLWYAYRLRQGQVDAPNTWLIGSLCMALGVLVIDLPLIAQILYYPRINGSTLPGMVVFVILVALPAGWAGSRLGEWMRAHGQQAETDQSETAPQFNRVMWVGAGALVAALAFLAYFINTATPPHL
ncbi:MAG: hypothetical protein R3E39_19595 [Anaerolineae bacterium]